jgi:hypothetical protein
MANVFPLAYVAVHTHAHTMAHLTHLFDCCNTYRPKSISCRTSFIATLTTGPILTSSIPIDGHTMIRNTHMKSAIPMHTFHSLLAHASML